MRRRRSIPFIYRWSRHLIGAIAALGVLETAFLTIAEFSGTAAEVCPTEGCKAVLSSPYATVFGLPLTLFGFLAYASMAILALVPLAINPETKKQLHSQLENTSWLLMFAIAVAMVVFSSHLMYVMLYKIQALCPYCIASAIFSLLLLVLTIIGRDWPDLGQLLFSGIAIGMVSLIGALGIYANINGTTAQNPTTASQSSSVTTEAGGETGAPIRNESGPDEIALARHLQQRKARMYGTYTCPHCHEQKELFGKEAFGLIDYVECNPKGKNARVKLCTEANIEGVPTWEMNGQFYPGVQRLETLADLSDYQGSRNFKHPFPYR